MSAAQSAAVVVPEDVEQQPSTTKKSKTKPKKHPPYAVILHNDELNGMDFVIASLRKVFHYGLLEAARLMMKAHVAGRSVVWTGSREVAELKADQLTSCGADPTMKSRGAGTLRVSIEPLPE